MASRFPSSPSTTSLDISLVLPEEQYKHQHTNKHLPLPLRIGVTSPPHDLIKPQAQKVLWSVRRGFEISTCHDWAKQLWPEIEHVRHVLLPLLLGVHTLDIKVLSEGAWNRSWVVTVTLDTGCQDQDKDTTSNLDKCHDNSQQQSHKGHNFNSSSSLWPALNLNNTQCRQFVMRIALPVYPWYKVEAEVATMSYVARHAPNIPVPQVFLYDSSPDNALGYEWILMEYMPGQPLSHTSLSRDQGMCVARTLADWYGQLSCLRFPAIGSLYFANLCPSPSSWLPCPDDPDFCIGPVVAQNLLGDWRLSYPWHKGPFLDEGAYARATIASRRYEAQDPLQRLRAEKDAYEILLENSERHNPRPWNKDDQQQREAQIIAAMRNVEHIRTCLHDGMRIRGLAVDIDKPARFNIYNDRQMHLFELQYPLPWWLDGPSQAVRACSVMNQMSDLLWPPSSSPNELFPHLQASSVAGTIVTTAPQHSDYTLFHWDTSDDNLLVDPLTGQPTALLDWEHIHTSSQVLRGFVLYPTCLSFHNSSFPDSGRSLEDLCAMRNAYLARLRGDDYDGTGIDADVSPLFRSAQQLCICGHNWTPGIPWDEARHECTCCDDHDSGDSEDQSDDESSDNSTSDDVQDTAESETDGLTRHEADHDPTTSSSSGGRSSGDDLGAKSSCCDAEDEEEALQRGSENDDTAMTHIDANLSLFDKDRWEEDESARLQRQRRILEAEVLDMVTSEQYHCSYAESLLRRVQELLSKY